MSIKKSILILIILMGSISAFAAEETNLNAYFDMSGNYDETIGSTKTKFTMSSSFSLGGNYLFEAGSFQIGHFINYQLDREIKGSSYGGAFLSFGGLIKKSLNKNIYLFGGVGLNTFAFNSYTQNALVAAYAALGYTVSVSTSGGITYLFGAGYNLDENFSTEFLYMNNTGTSSVSGGLVADIDVTYSKFSLGINYKI